MATEKTTMAELDGAAEAGAVMSGHESWMGERVTPSEQPAERALDSRNNTLALVLVGLVLLMLVGAVGISILVLHFESIHGWIT